MYWKIINLQQMDQSKSLQVRGESQFQHQDWSQAPEKESKLVKFTFFWSQLNHPIRQYFLSNLDM